MKVTIYLAGNLAPMDVHDLNWAATKHLDRDMEEGGIIALYSADGTNWAGVSSAVYGGKPDRVRYINAAHIVAYDVFEGF